MCSDAKASCEGEGGQLPIILSSAQDAAIRSLLTDEGYTGQVWMGASDVAAEGTFIWISGKHVEAGGANPFLNWKEGEPNNGAGGEDCMTYYKWSGEWKWNDRSCVSILASVCENVQAPLPSPPSAPPSPPSPPDVPETDLLYTATLELEIPGSLEDVNASQIISLSETVVSLLGLPSRRITIRVVAASVKIIIEASADSVNQANDLASRLNAAAPNATTASATFGLTVLSVSVVIVYPSPPSAPPATVPPPVANIVGGILGGFGLIVLAVAAGVWIRNYRRRRRRFTLYRKKGPRGWARTGSPGTQAFDANSASSSSSSSTGGGGVFGNIMGWFSSVTNPIAAEAQAGRYCARSLVLGQPEVAAAGLKVALGLAEDLEFAGLLEKGIDEIKNEFELYGSQDDKDNLCARARPWTATMSTAPAGSACGERLRRGYAWHAPIACANALGWGGARLLHSCTHVRA